MSEATQGGWINLSEDWREYRFPNDEYVLIEDVRSLLVSNNGHRIVDADGFSHYVPKGWIHMTFKASDGEPFFVA